jgi:formylglycine-generating enzyme required for sulfatase activity
MIGRIFAFGFLFLLTISLIILIPIAEPMAKEGTAQASPTPQKISQSVISQTDTNLHRKTIVPNQKTWKDPITGMEFVWVEGGCYQMGCENNGQYSRNSESKSSQHFADIPYWQWPLAVVTALLPVGCASPTYYQRTGCFAAEQPAHEVCVDSFYMGKYEVTQKEYKKIIEKNPSRFRGDNYPTEKVSWLGTQIFIHKLNNKSEKIFRLPTEAEWEYAARSGGKNEKYAGSNSINAVAWHRPNSGDSTQRVGEKSPNGLGLYDMSGNVWEWCSDYYGKKYYSTSPKKNPQGPIEGESRVARGGSWSLEAPYARTAFRFWYNPASHYGAIGFRLVISEL